MNRMTDCSNHNSDRTSLLSHRMEKRYEKLEIGRKKGRKEREKRKKTRGTLKTVNLTVRRKEKDEVELDHPEKSVPSQGVAMIDSFWIERAYHAGFSLARNEGKWGQGWDTTPPLYQLQPLFRG